MGVAEAGDLSSRNELLHNGASALLYDGLGHHLQGLQAVHQVVLCGPIITINLPIWLSHKRQAVFEFIHLTHPKQLV
jgi:hypothetical protein